MTDLSDSMTSPEPPAGSYAHTIENLWQQFMPNNVPQVAVITAALAKIEAQVAALTSAVEKISGDVATLQGVSTNGQADPDGTA